MACFKPIPTSQLKRLDEVRVLLDKLGPRQNEELVEFIISPEEKGDNHRNMPFVKEENIKEESDDCNLEIQAAKKMKIEKEEDEINIGTLLRETTDLEKVWERLNNTYENKELSVIVDKNSEEILVLLKKLLTSKKLENVFALEYFQSLMLKYFLLVETDLESYEQFFEVYLTLYPSSVSDIASKLLVKSNLNSLVIFILNMDLLDEHQEKLILSKWLTLFSIESDNMELPEVILNKNSKLYEDQELVAALASSFSEEKNENSDKCSKFSKFLLKVLSMLRPGCNEKTIHNLRRVIERNKTFLKKRLQSELNKKVS